jgi:hypothetical protein
MQGHIQQETGAITAAGGKLHAHPPEITVISSGWGDHLENPRELHDYQYLPIIYIDHIYNNNQKQSLAGEEDFPADLIYRYQSLLFAGHYLTLDFSFQQIFFQACPG